MSRAEADVWAEGSAYPATVYHATTRVAEALIRQHGFDLGQRQFGRLWGNGIYASPERSVAELYADLHRFGATVVQLRVDVGDVLRVRLAPACRLVALQQVLTAFPEGFSRFVDLTIERQRMRPGEYARPEALTRAITEAGYDALEIVEVGFTPAIGGTQIVIYDPRKVVVIDD